MVYALAYLVSVIFVWGVVVGMDVFEESVGTELFVASLWPVFLVFVAGAYVGDRLR